jgi:Zn finger protein HypA/HybF involved in hydrogenase expression
MGISQEFRCEACGMTAEVAGGPSGIKAGETDTRFCPTCRTLVDVMTTWRSGMPADRHRGGLNECPTCNSTQLTPWRQGQPCPVCGGKMTMTGSVWETD